MCSLFNLCFKILGFAPSSFSKLKPTLLSLLGHLVGGNDILNSRSHACNNAAIIHAQKSYINCSALNKLNVLKFMHVVFQCMYILL